MISLMHYFLLSTVLFAIGLFGLLIRWKNLIHVLMCTELLLLSINTQFIALSYYLDQLSGQIIVFFILAVTASETAVSLAILVLLFRQKGTIEIEALRQLKG